MSPPAPLLLLLLPFLLSAAAPSLASLPNVTASDQKLNAYQVLQAYNFPVGLLPVGVLGYDLDPATGKFAAYLDGDCSFSLEGSYDLKYKSTISGYISQNRLSSLQGVTVKVLLFWINIVEIVRSGDELQFSVGILSADFPISNFEVCPKCGCGIDCLNADGGGDGSGESVRLKSSF